MSYKLGYPTAELVDMFLSDCDVMDSSITNYRHTLNQFIFFLMKVKECIIEGEDNIFYNVQRKHIVEYKKFLKFNKSAATCDNYLTSVRLFFSWLYENDFIKFNHAYGIKSPRRSKEYKKLPLTVEQLKQLMSTCNRETAKGKRDYAIICLMAINGLRRKEVMEIEYGDIQKEIINGEETIGLLIRGKGEFEKQFTSLSDVTYNSIQEYLKLFEDLKPNQKIFIGFGNNNHYKEIHNTYLSKLIKSKLKEIGLDSKRYSAHSLRHTAATLLLQESNNLSEVMSMLRHKSITTTEIYIKTVQHKNQIINIGTNKVGNLFKSSNDRI